jgi:perosamine synthetase
MVGGVPPRDPRAAREIDGVTPPSDPDNGVSSKVYFDPVHRSHYYVEEYGQDIANLPVTDQVSSRVLSLPMHPHLEAEVIERIAESLTEALR